MPGAVEFSIAPSAVLRHTRVNSNEEPVGEHYDKLSEHERVALDWYVKGLLTGDIQEDFSRFQQHAGRIPIVHPDEYREAAREFFAFDVADVQDIHRRYREHLSIQHGIRPHAPERDR